MDTERLSGDCIIPTNPGVRTTGVGSQGAQCSWLSCWSRQSRALNVPGGAEAFSFGATAHECLSLSPLLIPFAARLSSLTP
ncbi:hypothetical protein N7456_002068 [Penicillium angulare]|uniref:Uncharacterized protein n=1 Tax=Penicillium angulare TaxID=116970 RepID=A0A9W9KNP1_9EURO|nr:hypothetical protein N7456_002068 [Penicillium angulare]